MKFRLLLTIAALALVAFLVWHQVQNAAGKKENGRGAGDGAKRPVPVTVTESTLRDVPIWLSGLGTVQAFNKVTIRPRVGGVLEEVSFAEGGLVKEGDVLARIDPRPYESILAEAKAKVAQTAAQLENARKDFERVAQLVKSDAESRQALELSEANVAQFTAQQQADVAAEEAARLNLDFTTVKAPIAGRTGVRMIDKGNLVTPSQDGGLVVISQFQPISLNFTLPQDNLPALRQGMSQNSSGLTVQAMTDDGRVLAEGKLALIDNEIDPGSGTIKLKAEFPNKDEALWPGQFVQARVLIETRSGAVVVPTQVITAGREGPFAYVVKSDLTVEVRNVKVGPRVEEITVIEDGLKAGENVVLDGQSKLQPGALVAVSPSKP